MMEPMPHGIAYTDWIFKGLLRTNFRGVMPPFNNVATEQKGETLMVACGSLSEYS